MMMNYLALIQCCSSLRSFTWEFKHIMSQTRLISRLQRMRSPQGRALVFFLTTPCFNHFLEQCVTSYPTVLDKNASFFAKVILLFVAGVYKYFICTGIIGSIAFSVQTIDTIIVFFDKSSSPIIRQQHMKMRCLYFSCSLALHSELSPSQTPFDVEGHESMMEKLRTFELCCRYFSGTIPLPSIMLLSVSLHTTSLNAPSRHPIWYRCSGKSCHLRARSSATFKISSTRR